MCRPIGAHGFTSANSSDDMWTAIDGDNLPAGIDMVVLDNAMAMGSEDALACLARYTLDHRQNTLRRQDMIR